MVITLDSVTGYAILRQLRMNDLCIPKDALKQHLVVLGKTGAGKSSALRHIVEHLLRNHKRVCIIDPKGDWAGLKLSADGKSPGFEIIGFGDFKMERGTDVPINQHSGKHIAELIASGNRPCMIGFRGWMTSHMIRFWIDFASTLFHSNSGELYLIGDEFHNFAPKGKIMDPESGKCLHWSNRLMSEGRGYGLVCLIASQRPQKVHNDTLTCCETLVAMRVIHKADRDAVEDWIDGCGDPAQGKIVLNALAGMARGEAFVWSPEINYGPERVKFPMFTTFDSFAPPQLQKKVSDAGWASIALDDVKKKLASVIEEHEQNDPAILKRRVAELKKSLAATLETQVAKEIIKEVPVLTADNFNKLQIAFETLDDIAEGVKQTAQKMMDLIRSAHKPAAPAVPQRQISKLASPPPRKSVEASNGDSKISKCGRALLSVLAQYPDGCNRKKLCLLAGYCWSGSTQNALGFLRSVGAVAGDNDGTIQITQPGLDWYGPFEPLPSFDQRKNFWLNHPSFGLCDRRLLAALFENTNGLARDELLKETGYEWSGSTQNALGRLRTAGVIEGKNNDTIKIAADLWE